MFTSTFFFFLSITKSLEANRTFFKRLDKRILPDNRILFAGKNKGATEKHIGDITAWKKPIRAKLNAVGFLGCEAVTEAQLGSVKRLNMVK